MVDRIRSVEREVEEELTFENHLRNLLRPRLLSTLKRIWIQRMVVLPPAGYRFEMTY
jgi:hypothetical protein